MERHLAFCGVYWGLVMVLVGGAPLLLYSTNTYLKFRIQEDYRKEHHVWCSPAFEAAKLGRYAIGAGTPPSSDPASIYRNLCRAVKEADDHDSKIAEQKKVLLGLAVEWCYGGLISDAAREEITAIVTGARFPDWRPLLFVMPYHFVAARVREVPRANRASIEREYIIPDLKVEEFHIIEPSI
jgi:hypothetical protein